VKANTAIGVAGAVVCLIVAVIMEGGSPASLLNIPALLIVVGGTGMATFASTTMEGIKNVPRLYKKSFGGSDVEPAVAISQMVGLAEKARRDGLLALDEQLGSVEDPYTKKGLQLVVDGTDPDLVADVLDAENDAMKKRHQAGTQPFEKAGGYAPTMGIIGTVFGLVHVLSNLDAPETLGPSISAAFIATLLGVASANVVFLPVAARLKQLSAEEQLFRTMTLEGILAIQAGDNPRVVQEKLMAYVPPAQRPAEGEELNTSAEKVAA
jgi:chemotaxis protein MotA